MHKNLALFATLFATPALAASDSVTAVDVFIDAAPMPKLIMIAMLIAIIAAIAVCVRKLMSGPRLAGGSVYLSSLRFGGPLFGCLGAAYTGVSIWLGIANWPTSATLKLVAPGLAEATFVAGLGFLAGAVAAICNWAVEARIDREVLKS